MRITPLSVALIPAVEDLIRLGEPYVRPRTTSDYWLYASLFSGTCPIAVDDDGTMLGVVIAFRSQDHPNDVYVQDVMVHPNHRRRGLARVLLDAVRAQASAWGCMRLYLTSEPDNTAAHNAWLKMGFTNVSGDYTDDGVSVVRDYKGPGKDRAVYELSVSA